MEDEGGTLFREKKLCAADFGGIGMVVMVGLCAELSGETRRRGGKKAELTRWNWTRLFVEQLVHVM